VNKPHVPPTFEYLRQLIVSYKLASIDELRV